MRVRTQAAGDVHPEPGLVGAVLERSCRSDHADVVEHRLAALGRATGEVDLELARQALTQRVAHEVFERGLGPRRDIEELVRARTGQVAGHDVANSVATCLASGQPGSAERTHHVGDLGQFDEVDLHVLARRDVAPTARVGLGEVAHEVELLRGDRAGRQLDAHHLVGAALALAVDTVVQAEHAEDVFADLAGKVLGNRALEPLDVALLLCVEISGAGNNWCNAHAATPLRLRPSTFLDKSD